MTKFAATFFILLVNYLLLSAIIFFFSLISLQQGKVYDFFWIKYIQKELYEGGFRNIFQFNTNNCVKFDKNLMYVPINGECEFNNPEFKTTLNFDDERRLNLVNDQIDQNENVIAVLGDSIAMGWGVENSETFSFNLQKLINKKVINFGVASYGTIREIKRLKKSKFYNQIDTVIIQYHINDFGENLNLSQKKIYKKAEFEKLFSSYEKKTNSIKFLIRIYKKTLRLSFSHLNDILFPNKNLEIKSIDRDLDILQKIILQNFSYENKKIIVFVTSSPWQKLEYNQNKKFEKFEFHLINLKNKHNFIIDDHPNVLGHKFISVQLYNFLKNN